MELFLGNAILEPVVTHVKGFGFFQTHVSMQNTVCSGVIGFNWSVDRRLRMAHFFQGGDHGNGFLGIKKETASFGFGGRGSDGANSFAEHMNRTVGCGRRRRTSGTRKGSEEKMSSSTAANIGKDKICSIGTNGKNHVTGMIADGGIGVCREIVKKHIAGLFGCLGRRSLTVGNFVQRDNDRWVAAAGIIEKETGDLLDSFDTEFVEEGRNVGRSELCLLTVDRSQPAMRGMLRSGRWWMTQSEKCFGNVAGHRDVNVASGIVPFDRETEVTRPGPVFRERILGGEGVEKMAGIGSREEFNAEIIDSECESGTTILVAPKAGGLTYREVTERGKMSFELVVGENGSLFAAIHAFANLDIDVTFGVEVRVGQIVFGDDFVSEILAVDPHILIDYHVGNKEKIL